MQSGTPALCDAVAPLREDEHGMPELLQCLEGRSNGGLNVQVAGSP